MTAGEALLIALERADGAALIMETGERPRVITCSGAVREIGSRQMSAATMHAIICELVPEPSRLMLYRSHAVVQPLDVGSLGRGVLTATYIDGRFALRLERWSAAPSPPVGWSAGERPPEPGC